MKEEIMSRVNKLLASMRAQSIDAVLLATEEHSTKNVRYFSNFSGSTGYTLIAPDKQMIFTDSRYWEQTQAQSPLAFEKIKELNPRAFVSRYFQSYKRIGYEAKAMTVDFFNVFKAYLPPYVEWIPIDGLISTIRCAKSVEEKNKIVEANKIAIAAFKEMIGELKEGMTEKEAATILEFRMMKLGAEDKAFEMQRFVKGQAHIMVATTVIEVGVNIPNASVMVIENAERYGLSALHQLRGRVGRGAAESWCFLVSDNTSEAVQKRLKFLCSTTDGFAVAQYDLETRGPGDFFGSRQHGLPTLQIADLMNDTRTLHAAQSEATALLAADPLLESPAHALLAAQVQQMFDKAGPMN